MIRETLIGLHAVGGGIAFIAGARVLVPPTGHHAHRRWLFTTFLAALAWMIGFLLAVVAIDWPQLEAQQRAVYGGLCLLALYMGWRAWGARQALVLRSEGWRRRYLTCMGFNLVALFEGFVIVAAIDLGMQGWLVAIIAVLGILIGRWAIHLPRFVSHHEAPEADATRR